ncbi:IDEAL domain-containing protein [Metabacillus fastidiosus]|uniref:IDEAL domain-containing protein n=1 Tax=Metabacillus fastidiosus TaxID=1458 RepID=UPI003D2BEE0C
MKHSDWVQVLILDRIIVGYVDVLIGDRVYVWKVCEVRGKERKYLKKHLLSSYYKNQCTVMELELETADMKEIIDLALATHDKEWFQDLTDRLIM